MNPRERDDDFLNAGNGETDFDVPTAKRRGFSQKSDKAPGAEAEEEDYAGASRGYFVRRTLREREQDEAREDREARRPTGKRPPAEEDEYEEYESESQTKAPPVVRIFAWAALLAIFFVGGYAGANYFFSRADKPGARVGGVVGGGPEVRSAAGVPTPGGLGEAAYKLYMPAANGEFEEREIKIRKGLPEEDIRQLLTMYIDGLKELSELERGVRVQSIFRSGDWLYIDMSQDFLGSLKTLGKDKATIVLTGIVRNMQENFPAIKKVKFYIDSKESKDKNPVDIENAWELKN